RGGAAPSGESAVGRSRRGSVAGTVRHLPRRAPGSRSGGNAGTSGAQASICGIPRSCPASSISVSFSGVAHDRPLGPLLVRMTGSTESSSDVHGGELVAQLAEIAESIPARIDVDPDAVERDLSKLVLTLVELLRRVVEHQAVRRMDDPDLTEDQVERMGTALWRLEQKMEEIKQLFGLADEELNIDLGPLGKVL